MQEKAATGFHVCLIWWKNSPEATKDLLFLGGFTW
ncbi:hypothetical protein ECP03018678_5183, partial [Escherichia coli P0301867.8]